MRILFCNIAWMKEYRGNEDVLVVYCAKHSAHNFTTIVGWYKHAK